MIHTEQNIYWLNGYCRQRLSLIASLLTAPFPPSLTHESALLPSSSWAAEWEAKQWYSRTHNNKNDKSNDGNHVVDLRQIIRGDRPHYHLLIPFSPSSEAVASNNIHEAQDKKRKKKKKNINEMIIIERQEQKTHNAYHRAIHTSIRRQLYQDHVSTTVLNPLASSRSTSWETN